MYSSFFVDEVASTNDLARTHAKQGGVLPALFVARRQTSGRGRMGHDFHSASGGLYMSLCLRPDSPASQAVRLTVAAAVAAAQVLEELTHTPIDIKWVNDLYMNGRKVGGILTEGSVAQDGSLSYAVIGIGINLRHVDFPPELRSIATCVEDEVGIQLSPQRVACDIAERLLRIDPNADALIEQYRRRCFVIGQQVTVLRGEQSYTAVAVGLREDAALIVRLPDGTEEALFTGDVRIQPQKRK